MNSCWKRFPLGQNSRRLCSRIQSPIPRGLQSHMTNGWSSKQRDPPFNQPYLSQLRRQPVFLLGDLCSLRVYEHPKCGPSRPLPPLREGSLLLGESSWRGSKGFMASSQAWPNYSRVLNPLRGVSPREGDLFTVGPALRLPTKTN